MLKTIALIATLAATAFLPAVQAQQRNSFRIENDSNVRINEVYVSSVDDRTWGHDLLRGYMFPNQYIDLEVYDGYYDVKVVDKDGDACVISNQHLYGGSVWTLDNVKLLSCEILTAAH